MNKNEKNTLKGTLAEQHRKAKEGMWLIDLNKATSNRQNNQTVLAQSRNLINDRQRNRSSLISESGTQVSL